MEHWAEKIFRKNYPKTCSKHVWTLLGTILGIFGILKISRFFENISKTRRSMEHWAKKISKKLPQNLFKTRLDILGTILGVFWILKIFLKHFEDSTLNGTVGKTNFSKKLPQNMLKTRVDTFGNNFGHFWIFENFLKTFRWLDTPWNTWQKFFSKKLPQNLFKTCLDNLGTNLGVFAILKLFKFFQKPFEDSTFHGTLGRKNFSEKKIPQDMFKTRLDTFGNDSGHFWNFEIFLNLYKDIS